MNIKEFKQLAPVLMKNKIVPFIWGSQGVGKTQTVKQICSEHGLDIRILHCATQEVGDLVGLLIKSSDGESVHHARPSWFPTEGQGIIFLDELNRAPMDVIQAMFSFITDGKLHTHVLPEGWHIMAAGNYESDRFTTTSTQDAAWLSRFCHLDFTPTTEEWLMYAENAEMFDVADFIREQPSMLELDAKTAGRMDTSVIVPDRRSWYGMVGRLENDPGMPENLKYEVYSGIVGTVAAAAYSTWKNKKERALSLNMILRDYKKTGKIKVLEATKDHSKARFDLLNQPIDELIAKIENDNNFLINDKFISNLKEFFLDIPKELAMKAFVKLATIKQFAGRNELLNDPVYVNRFKNEI